MPASETKPTNPKDLLGTNKIPYHLVPPVAIAHAALAHLDGNLKYGRNNWREAGVRSSVYVSAAMRHLMAWLEGEDWAPDSKVHHLGHAIACCNILLDAMEAGMLIDDRNHKGRHYLQAVENLTPLVAEARVRYADRQPQHYDLQSVREAHRREHIAGVADHDRVEGAARGSGLSTGAGTARALDPLAPVVLGSPAEPPRSGGEGAESQSTKRWWERHFPAQHMAVTSGG